MKQRRIDEDTGEPVYLEAYHFGPYTDDIEDWESELVYLRDFDCYAFEVNDLTPEDNTNHPVTDISIDGGGLVSCTGGDVSICRFGNCEEFNNNPV